MINFATPAITKTEINNVVRVIESGWLTTGKLTKKFGEELANHIGAKYCVPMSSCTAALHIALKCAGVKEGDEVITSPLTFVSTINVITYLGAKPVLVDIKPSDFIINEQKIEQAITSKTKAIMPVHYGGYVANLNKLRKLSKKYKISLVEDAAHVYGSKYNNEFVGEKSEYACFSFYPTKNITSIEGGALVTNDEKIYNKASSLALHGISKDAWKRYTKVGTWKYDVKEIGFKYNMTDVQAAVGLAQLKRINSFKKKRDNIFNFYKKELEKIKEVRILEGNKHSDPFRHLCVLKINSWMITRDDFVEEMKNRGIICSVHFIPVYKFSVYKKLLNHSPEDFLETEKAFNSCVSIPLSSSMSMSEAKEVVSAIKNIFKKQNFIENPILSLSKKPKSFFDDRFKQVFPSKQILFNRANPPIIYGAGVVGRSLQKTIEKRMGIKIKFFVDKDSSLIGKKINGSRVIAVEELRDKYFNQPIIIASVIYEQEILGELIKRGFPNIYPLSYLNYLESKIFDYRNYRGMYNSLFQPRVKKEIIKLNNLLADNESKKVLQEILRFRLDNFFGSNFSTIKSSRDQYFDSNIIKKLKNEIFVDGGACNGDTIEKISEMGMGKFKNIYSFEPDKKNYKLLSNKVKQGKLSNVTTIMKGIYKEEREIEFNSLGSPESGISNRDEFNSWSGETSTEDGSGELIKISTIDLDSFFKDKAPPTFIKMDIEGAEHEALLGAKKIISEHKPKLAICVYHKPSDLWRIPALIHKLNPKYKFYLRHYSNELCETICYAI